MSVHLTTHYLPEYKKAFISVNNILYRVFEVEIFVCTQVFIHNKKSQHDLCQLYYLGGYCDFIQIVRLFSPEWMNDNKTDIFY